MKRLFIAALGPILAVFSVAGCNSGAPLALPAINSASNSAQTPRAIVGNQVPAAKKTLQAFHSDAELMVYFRHLQQERLKLEAKREEQERKLREAWEKAHEEKKGMKSESARSTVGGFSSPSPAPAAAQTDGRSAFSVAVDKDESVTNTQHAGVDEGGIVKVHGDHLVVLRRGRLFTVAIGDGALTPVSSIDAFGPDIDPRYTWYDEMLVSEDTIVVIGYSYERGGTEVGLFGIDPAGKLTYRSTYHLRSNDYYSSRNYASRLIGSKLIFYSPLYFLPGVPDPFQYFPAVRKWHKGAKASEFKRIVTATEVYRPAQATASEWMALHTVTICDLANGGFDCKATSVIGPEGEVFYVAPQSVYIWLTEWMPWGEQSRARSIVYRMPLDGSAPTALRVSGSPVDQFSFLESEDGYLNVLVMSEGRGDWMWGAERKTSDVSLMRVALNRFSDGSDAAPFSSYRKLPKAEGYFLQNRFVGDYLLYGTGNTWSSTVEIRHPKLYAVRWDGGDPHELSLTHGVDRIEQIGSDAIVVGGNGRDLYFTTVRLGKWPELADKYVRRDASQGEPRSQGFFYKPDGPDSGILGLPIRIPPQPAYYNLLNDSEAVLFLKNNSLHFQEVGELEAKPPKTLRDGCRASCVDWYGNSRPLFVRGRIIALLGYELVEGKLDDDGRISEMRRVNYAPQSLTARRQ